MAEKAQTKEKIAPKVIEKKIILKDEPKVEKKVKRLFDDWELKDRMYRVTGRHRPALYWLQSRPSSREGLLYWDGKRNRQLRYASNFDTPFKDEQDGTSMGGVIKFEEGVLFTKANQIGLQQFLELHPKKDVKFYLIDNEAVAADELEELDIEFEATRLAKELDIDMIEAIMRTQLRSAVDNMTTKELRKDARYFAKQNPRYFLQLATDEDIALRNLAIKATELNFIGITDNSVVWADTQRKIIDIGFDENPYTKLVSFFKKDEGIDLMKALKHKLEQ